MSRSMRKLLLACVLPPLAVISIYLVGSQVANLIEENKELRTENKTIVEQNTKIGKENALLNDNLWIIKEELQKQHGTIEDLKQDLGKQKRVNTRLLEENKSLKSEIRGLKSELEASAKVNRERATIATSQMPSRGEVRNQKSFYVEATAYVALCDTGCTGVTATGIDLRKNPNAKVIAVDPSIIPLGSKVYVEGYGYAIAGDTGGAIKGYKVDLHVPTTSIARQWGRKKVKLTILN